MADTQNTPDAQAIVTNALNAVGLGSLAPVVFGYLTAGSTPDVAMIRVQQTPEWKQRFAGNIQREKQGLAPLDPATYLDLEKQYSQVLRSFGISPALQTPDTYANLIGNNVSPAEVQSRAGYAYKFAQNHTDQATKDTLQSYYGIGHQDIASYFLDPNKAQSDLDRISASVDIGAAAQRQQFQLSQQQAAHYADLGVSAQQADKGAAQASLALPEESQIAHVFGQDYTQQDAADQYIGGLASAQRKAQLLNQQQGNLFSENSSNGPRSLGATDMGGY